MLSHISKNALVILCVLALTTITSAPLYAQQGNTQPKSLSESLKKVTDTTQKAAGIKDFSSPQDLIVAILKIVLAIVAIIAVAAIMYGAFLYITSAGDEGRAATGKKIILYAIIGLILMAAAAIIVNVVINIFFAGGGGGGNGLGDDPCKAQPWLCR